MADVVVIGAGISGAASAYALASAGHHVVLLDRFGPAAMASGSTLAGVRQSGRHASELPLARAAVARWARLSEELGADTHYRRKGNLRLARNDAEAEVITRLVADQKAAGLDISLLATNADVRDVAPAISEAVVAASFCPSDGHADPQATIAGFVAAARRHGAELRFGECACAIEVARGRVAAVVTKEGRIPAEHVVVAAGVFVNELLEPLGLGIPLRVPMVTVVRSAPSETVLEQVIGVANADCAGRQEVDGRFRVTSGLQQWHGILDEERGRDSPRPAVRPTASSLAEVVRKFSTVVPAFAEARIEAFWSGLIDLTPDTLPVIDTPAEVRGLVIAAGFSGHGFCLGPVTGEIVADLVAGRTPDLPIAPFRLDRFATTKETAPVMLHG